MFFIWEVYGSTKVQLLYLIGYVVFATYLVKIYLYLRKKYGRNKYIYGHAVFLSLLPLLAYKVGGLGGYSVLGFLGISYICFKIIQVVIECYDGVIKETDEFQFIEFLIFFPCLSSGPIDRSRRFAEDDNKICSRQEYIELLWKGLYKIILGIFYKVACSGFSITFCRLILQENTSLYIWLAMLAFTAYICFLTLPGIVLWMLAPVNCLELKRRTTLINLFKR